MNNNILIITDKIVSNVLYDLPSVVLPDNMDDTMFHKILRTSILNDKKAMSEIKTIYLLVHGRYGYNKYNNNFGFYIQEIEHNIFKKALLKYIKSPITIISLVCKGLMLLSLIFELPAGSKILSVADLTTNVECNENLLQYFYDTEIFITEMLNHNDANTLNHLSCFTAIKATNGSIYFNRKGYTHVYNKKSKNFTFLNMFLKKPQHKIFNKRTYSIIKLEKNICNMIKQRFLCRNYDYKNKTALSEDVENYISLTNYIFNSYHNGLYKISQLSVAQYKSEIISLESNIIQMKQSLYYYSVIFDYYNKDRRKSEHLHMLEYEELCNIFISANKGIFSNPLKYNRKRFLKIFLHDNKKV